MYLYCEFEQYSSPEPKTWAAVNQNPKKLQQSTQDFELGHNRVHSCGL